MHTTLQIVGALWVWPHRSQQPRPGLVDGSSIRRLTLHPPSRYFRLLVFKIGSHGPGQALCRRACRIGFDEQRINGVSFMSEQKDHLQHPYARISPRFSSAQPRPVGRPEAKEAHSSGSEMMTRRCNATGYI